MFNTIFQETGWASSILYYGGTLAAMTGFFYGTITKEWLFKKHLKLFLIIGILGGFVARAYSQLETFYALLIAYMFFYVITVLAWAIENYVKGHPDIFPNCWKP